MGGLFSGDWGDFRGRGGEGVFSVIWRGSSGVFEAHPGTPVPFFLIKCRSARMSHLQRHTLGVTTCPVIDVTPALNVTPCNTHCPGCASKAKEIERLKAKIGALVAAQGKVQAVKAQDGKAAGRASVA